MYHWSDQFAKNVLRDALGRASTAETEVEVLAATQKIDIYAVPDPARAAERAQLGLLGELAAVPSLFEPFHDTPSLRKIRRCLNKQLSWHHELERRARASPGGASAEAVLPEVPFPALVVIGPGVPATVLDAYGCRPAGPGVYHGVWGLGLRVVVLAELPRTRETLLLRLLGKGKLLREALVDLAALPSDAWERGVATPLLVHFQLEASQHPTIEEDDVSAEIRAWFEDYERKLRSQSIQEGHSQGERSLLLRLLRARFGELPPAAIARVQTAAPADIERWSERLLDARTLDDVLGEPGRSS